MQTMNQNQQAERDGGFAERSGLSWGQDLAALGLSLVICFVVAGLGGMVTTPEIGGWYNALRKPSWTPPDWIFGPVWTLLYAMMAVAAWLVWRAAEFARTKAALILFGCQLVLNFLWSWIFFGAHQLGFAAVELLVLWCFIVATLVAFWRHVAAAGLLLVPYLLWVSFAGCLNVAVWWLNR